MSPAPAAFRLSRPLGGPGGRAFAIAPLVDVLLILLVFFLVTSTWRDLDMIPMAERGEAPLETAAPAAAAGPGRTLLLRLGADGALRAGGRRLTAEDAAAAVAAAAPASVLILPSPRAPAQALVDALGAAAAGGAARVQVVRVAERP